MAKSPCKHGLPQDYCAGCKRQALRVVTAVPYRRHAGRVVRGIAFRQGQRSWHCVELGDPWAKFLEIPGDRFARASWPAHKRVRNASISTEHRRRFCPRPSTCGWPQAHNEHEVLVLRESFELGKGRLGCFKCRYFLCSCGTCWCFYRGGWVYPGRNIPPFAKRNYSCRSGVCWSNWPSEC